MSSSDISSVTAQLAQASVDETGILSFAGKGLKLDGKEQGER